MFKLHMLLVLWLCYSITNALVLDGTLRFYRNGTPDSYISPAWASGIVQIYLNNSWGNICDDGSFGQNEATVICTQLKYSGGASSYDNTGNTGKFGQDPSPAVVDGVDCPYSGYAALTDCSYHTTISTTCLTTNTDVVVECNPPEPGTIRLISNGPYTTWETRGIVQVFYSDQWGNICQSDVFRQVEGHVICNQLGYNGAIEYFSTKQSSNFGEDPLPPVLDKLYCSSPAFNSIADCTYTANTSGCLDPDRDVIVTCNQPKPGTIRVISNGPYTTFGTRGIVEIYNSNQWGNICEVEYGRKAEADVICRQLGYDGAIQLTSTGRTSNFGQDLSPAVFDHFNCSSSLFDSISECSYSTTISDICLASNRDIIIECHPPLAGTIRLVSYGPYTTSNFQGIVQIYLSGQWGNICEAEYGRKVEGDVICRQLGFNGAIQLTSTGRTSNFGQDYAPIVMDKVDCVSSSLNKITDCSYTTTISDTCLTTNRVMIVQCGNFIDTNNGTNIDDNNGTNGTDHSGTYNGTINGTNGTNGTTGAAYTTTSASAVIIVAAVVSLIFSFKLK